MGTWQKGANIETITSPIGSQTYNKNRHLDRLTALLLGSNTIIEYQHLLLPWVSYRHRYLTMTRDNDYWLSAPTTWHRP